MEQRRSRVETDQRKERIGAKLMSLLERMTDRVIGLEQRRHFPDKEVKRRTAEQNPSQTRDWLDQEQRIEAVFVGLGDGSLQSRHALWKRRQIGVILPPDQPRHANGPDQHARISVRVQKGRGKAAVVIDHFV